MRRAPDSPSVAGPPGFIGNVLTAMGQDRGMEYLEKLAAQKIERVLTNDPGMGVIRHVDAGYDRAVEVAADQFDMIDPLVNWVENGTAPAAVQAKARGTGTSTITALINAEVPSTWSSGRTRPLCPYPQVARYNGSGDMDSASNYSCK